jgi:hypothetical protein
VFTTGPLRWEEGAAILVRLNSALWSGISRLSRYMLPVGQARYSIVVLALVCYAGTSHLDLSLVHLAQTSLVVPPPTPPTAAHRHAAPPQLGCQVDPSPRKGQGFVRLDKGRECSRGCLASRPSPRTTFANVGGLETWKGAFVESIRIRTSQ